MTILAGKLIEDSGDLLVTFYHNPAFVSVTDVEKVSVGDWVVTIDKPILNSNIPPRWYIAGSEGNIYAVNQISTLQFTVQCFNPPTTHVDNSLSGAEFQLEIY